MKHLLALAALLLASADAVAAAAQSRWGEGYLPNLPVVTQTGETVRFYDDLVKGRIVVISFIYTSCRDLCPMVTARLAQLEDKLGDAMGREVFFISISVDPENDTPQKLKQYAEAFQAGPGWVFVTGKPEDIGAIRYKLGDRGAKASDHRNEVLLANAAAGDWERSSVFGDLNTLAVSVRAMDPIWRAEFGRGESAQTPANRSATASHRNLPGQALFARTCASCHTVGRGDKVGPDLSGLMSRRSREWVTSYITDPEKMRGERDATALALAEKFKTVRMPNLGLAEGDVQDLMAYVEAQTFNVSAGKPATGPHHH